MFSNIAIFLILTSNVIVETVKSWARTTEKGYYNFLQLCTSLYWGIDSIMDATINLPENIYDVFVADITRCYEAIPLSGLDNLLIAVNFLVLLAFRHAAAAQRASSLL